MKDLIRSVLEEFKGVKTALAVVHNSPSLGVLLDELLEKGLLSPAKRRRQGMRGSRSARNFMLRKALWYARALPKA